MKKCKNIFNHYLLIRSTQLRSSKKSRMNLMNKYIINKSKQLVHSFTITRSINILNS